MSATQNFLAFDFGAESGRALLATFDGDRLTLTDTHRFLNTPVRLNSGLHWDFLHLWAEIKNGLARAQQQSNGQLAALGIDTWGVDFGLLDRNNELLGNPHHYRDARTEGMLEEAFRRVPRAEIFEQTGIQFMAINTLFQLLAMRLQNSPLLENAATLLTVPNLFNFWLTGTIGAEFSHATTTQCYDPRQRDWAWPLLAKLDIPTHIFPRLIQPGENLGNVLPGVAAEVGLNSALPVIAVASHDTGVA